MQSKIISQNFVYSFAAAILFAVLSSPVIFKITNSITKKYGFEIATDDGTPYANGVALHSLVFFYILYVISMNCIYVCIPALLVLFTTLYFL